MELICIDRSNGNEETITNHGEIAKILKRISEDYNHISPWKIMSELNHSVSFQTVSYIYKAKFPKFSN
jgi:hypothetical protein